MAKGLVAYGPPHRLYNEHFDSILFSCPFSPLTFLPSFQNYFLLFILESKIITRAPHFLVLVIF